MNGECSRRKITKAGIAAGLIPIAGCSSIVPGNNPSNGGNPSGNPSEPQDTPERLSVGETYEMDGGAKISVSEVAHQHSVFYLIRADAMGVMSPDGRELLFCRIGTVASDVKRPAANEFSLVIGDDQLSPSASVSDVSAADMRPDSDAEGRYSRSEGDGWVLFPVPDGSETENAQIIWNDSDGDTVSWELSSETKSALRGSAPDLTVDELNVPKDTSGQSSVDLELTITNKGGAGTLRCVLNQQSGTYRPLTYTVNAPAEETVVKTISVSPRHDAETRYQFVSASLEQEFTLST